MMPMKNYTTKVSAARSIEAIQTALVKHGATGILYEYEPGTGRIAALRFRLPLHEHTVSFALPVNWRQLQRVLQEQKVARWQEEGYVYRVAWRTIHDWVMAQLAFYDTAMVEMGQLFLPFAMVNEQETLYEKVVAGQFLLGDARQEP